MDKPQTLVYQEKSLNYTCYDAKWIPKSARFVVLGCMPRGTGVIEVFSLYGGKLESQKQIEKKASFKCGTFGAALEDRLLATGDFDGRLSLWDLEHLSSPLYTVGAHKQIINTIDGCGGRWGHGAPEIVTGSRDGCVHVWDPRQDSGPVMSLIAPENLEKKPDCWAVAFGNSFDDSERCVACGYDNGDLKLLDMRTRSLRWEANLRNGICSLEFDRRDIEMNKLIATTLESKFYLFDMRTQHPQKGYANLAQKASEGTLWDVSHLPQNRELFATAGGKGSIDIWRYRYPSQRWRVDPEDGKTEGVMGEVEHVCEQMLSSQPIHSIDWNADKLGLGVVTSFDQTVRVIIVTRLNKYE
ncbi:putative WD repeat-containing protein 92 [Monocercomonoides exilis]|uniref:putative WD repeat-containing protein 92 n=1 Tax=Monocercomonoides exilis TaxID=2049356 RepID=UPI00355A166D|nr:putative WD repeat-containing protein 92 [Monocercomonoides exilis]|eukprot:MONOS_10485.1-p1 / transcript=MONOS_10485.1 / gene=MONOS_10485 / organism=Monocercomonoides_exilis_PA203 / gene_product=WD repeat-containing protein 92 / transcript_product=WD repeat-containing protein 92 / location=Mono_scaffold00478:44744-46302(-) / protein_length=355 / sequence_SO=supercontig / SO=protein_coding / is_pseudo=false